MKKRIINLRVILFGTLLVFSNEQLFGQTATLNSNQPAVQEMCGSAHLHNQQMQSDPAYAARAQEFENYVVGLSSSLTPKAAAQYRIPVVVHVLHKGEAVGTGTNVSDDAIRNAIKDLNDRYRKVAGTGGAGNGVDTEIEFALAVRNPSGQCTNGINRVSMTSNTAYMNYGVRSQTSQGITDAQAKAVASWDRTKYYNIYLVSEIDNNEGGAGIQGYAYFATSHGQSADGAVILASNFTAGNSMTTTHELGHALNLYHTFEGDGSGASCPSTTNGCGNGVGDCCADTPPHRRSQSDCNLTGTNSCNGNSSNSLFVRNYMDYSADACVNMFTANQKTRMLAACQTQRASFFATGNLALVPVAAPVVAFKASKSVICSGQTVTFTDMSGCVPNTYLPETNWPGITFAWTFTNGTVTLTSNLQNPTMTFTSPGSYNVTLTVTTTAGSNTLTQNNMVILGGTVTNACTPTSQAAGGYGQTVSNVKFNTINNTTSSMQNVAYQNFICDQNTIVTAGQVYSLSITGNAGPSGAERFEVYIDYNNDGVFANPGELVHSGSVPAGSQSALSTSTTSANVTIPATAVTNTLLRMRVIGNAGTITAGNRNCSSALFIGDVEDYGVYIATSGCTTAPTIGTQPAAATVCAGANNTFTVASTGASTYQWQVSTNGGSTWTNITNGGVYSNATTTALTITGATATLNSYRYRCITTNTCGSTNSSGVILTVNPSPSVSGTTPGNRCGTGTVVLGATASAGTLNWYAGATGGTSLGTGVSFTTPSISATTTYYVQATNSGCSSARTAVIATVNANPTITGTTPAGRCGTGTVVLGATASTGTPTWFANATGGTSIGTGASFTTPSISATTTYYVQTTSPGGCSSARTAVVATVNSNPTITGTTPADRCGTGTVVLGATATAGTPTWFTGATGGSSIGTGTSFTTPSISTTTTYYVQATNSGCSSARTAVVATVNANPTITGTTPASRCGAGTLVLGATASVGTPTWFANATGGTSIGTGASFTTPSISATTTYYVQTTNPDGCTSARTAVVATIGSAPTVIATSPNNTLCNGSSAELNASGAGTYTWSPGGMTGASVTVSPTETTTYTVTGTTSGCEGTATILITVTSCLGIEDQTADELLVLYPNPAQGWMTIEGSTLMNYANIELRDATGRLVSSWKIDQAKMDIDLTGYASGNYMVKILGSEGQVIKKVQIAK